MKYPMTQGARAALLDAEEEAALLGEEYVSTEHLLLGLVRDNDGVTARILKRLGISLGRLRTIIESEVWRAESRPAQGTISAVSLTPRAKFVIDLAFDEAQRLNDGVLGPEHVVLGLIRDGEGLAAPVLVQLGADLDRAREAIANMQLSATDDVDA